MTYQELYSNPVRAFAPWPDDDSAWDRAEPVMPSHGWVDLKERDHFATAFADKPSKALFVDLAVVLDVPWRERLKYVHSQLHWSIGEGPGESGVVCFRFVHVGRAQRMRILLPSAVMGAPRVRFTLVPLPYLSEGRFFVQGVRLVQQEDALARASELAVVYSLKESAQQEVARSEAEGRVMLPHYPVGMTLELTPRCNLTCTHCNSHGTPEAHAQSNRAPELSVERLEALADEVFPSLTEVVIVGRGEPFVVTNRLWETLRRKVVEHRVFLKVTTNGLLLHRRLTPDLMPHVASVQFSIDGGTEETFARNRGGASLAAVMRNVELFDRMRREADLLYPPKLELSWTLKRNNVHEFPDFLRRLLPLDVSLVYARQMMIFFDKDRGESLVGDERRANRYMREAYELLAAHGVATDCTPLMAEPPEVVALPVVTEVAGAGAEPVAPVAPQPPPALDMCQYVRRTTVVMAEGEVLTCPAPFVKMAGRLHEGGSFWDSWNGELMQDLRASLGTEREWSQCRHCVYRAGRFVAQRQAREGGEAYTPLKAEALDVEAFDIAARKPGSR